MGALLSCPDCGCIVGKDYSSFGFLIEPNSDGFLPFPSTIEFSCYNMKCGWTKAVSPESRYV